MNRTLKHLAKAAYVNLLPAELCDPHVDLETARALFVEYVELVEIENHSFCNRICWFCPNVFIDRRSVNHLMTDTLLDKIFSELGAIDYRGTGAP